MKVKVGDRIYDGEKEPVMVILSEDDKGLIASMEVGATKYCSYPEESKWINDDYKLIKKWMSEC